MSDCKLVVLLLWLLWGLLLFFSIAHESAAVGHVVCCVTGTLFLGDCEARGLVFVCVPAEAWIASLEVAVEFTPCMCMGFMTLYHVTMCFVRF